MRLLIVGTLNGQLTLATKLAMGKGAAVTHAEDGEMALRVLRSGRSADLLMVEVSVDIKDLIARMEKKIQDTLARVWVENASAAAVVHA